ncbi:PKHG5-like protein [Mya arenaria]|uniref:PKHG5-like protein n=1 Tax=Mya arenaria TaxID=6604 RepID=A0ABY7EV10_MYAAR|nr:PKHG5-like protein [Mya arenaria]
MKSDLAPLKRTYTLKRQGIIEGLDHSERVTAIVLKVKADENARICVDNKVPVNPLRLLNKHFLKWKACLHQWQLDIDFQRSSGQHIINYSFKKSQKAIYTHRGNLLVMGISPATAIWQCFLDQILKGIHEISSILNGMFIKGITDSICEHIITENGIHKSQDKIDAIVNDLTKRQQDQQKAIWELLQTELQYIRSTRVISDLFLCVLLNLQNELILNEIETHKLFNNISEISAANAEFWRNHLRKVLEETRNNATPLNPSLMKQGFHMYHDIFQPYVQYCARQKVCTDYMKSQYNENDLFKTFVIPYNSNFNLTAPMPGCTVGQTRGLVMQSPLKMKEYQNRMDVECLLFTDLLLICKANKRMDKYKIVKPPMRVDRIITHELKDKGSFLLIYVNEYHVPVSSFTFHGDQNAVHIWVTHIKKAQDLFQEAKVASAHHDKAMFPQSEIITEEVIGYTPLGMVEGSDGLPLLQLIRCASEEPDSLRADSIPVTGSSNEEYQITKSKWKLELLENHFICGKLPTSNKRQSDFKIFIEGNLMDKTSVT